MPIARLINKYFFLLLFVFSSSFSIAPWAFADSDSYIQTHKLECLDFGGEFSEKHNECFELDASLSDTAKQYCKRNAGSFKECASPCRHNAQAEMCITVCVWVCSFSNTNLGS